MELLMATDGGSSHAGVSPVLAGLEEGGLRPVVAPEPVASVSSVAGTIEQGWAGSRLTRSG
jgi:hypothetical protein